MGTVIPPRFRPTIVVCVGEQGRAVGAQLLALLPSLGAARQAGIAVLAVNEATPECDGAAMGAWFDQPPQRDPLASEMAPAGARASLPLLVVEALRGQGAPPAPEGERPHLGVLDDSVIWRIKEAGYAVPKASVMIWVVAAAHSPSLRLVTENIHTAMDTEGVDCTVILALPNVYPRDPVQHREQARLCAEQPWHDLLVGQRDHKPLATFAYLFETHDEKDTFWEGAADVPFAVAEAIFVLTASGITTTREFEETLRRSLPQMVQFPFERLSSIGTSRLTFPRAQAEQYCAAQLGAAILREWAPLDQQHLADEEAQEQKSAVQKFVNEMRRRLDDDPSERMRRGGRPSPRLSAEAIAQAHHLTRPRPDDGFIFDHLTFAALHKYRAGYGDAPDTPEALAAQAAKAEEGFALWKQTVRVGWERYEREIQASAATYANNLALDGAAGVTRAQIYTAELHRLLTDEKARLADMRERRETGYTRFLRRLDAICEGPWEWEPASRPAQEPDTGATHDEAGQPKEPEIIERLTQRYRWRKQHQPAVAAIAGAGLATLTPAVLLGQLLLPPAWMAQRFSLLLLTATIALILALAGWAYAYYRRRQVDEAAADLRAIYRRMFAYRCEQYEDQRRAALMFSTLARTRQLLDRFADWKRFMQEAAEQLEREAGVIERDLFEGAIGRRDVLVANRQQLRRNGYTLQRFERDVSALRAAKPIAGCQWHSNVSDILLHLRDHLRGGLNVVDSSPAALLQSVRDFTRSIVQPYLTGDMVDLGAALDAMPAEQSAGLFDTLAERSVILYRPVDTPRAPVMFIAARDEHRQVIMRKSQPVAPVLLRLADREWLALLRLLPGGTTPSFADQSNATRKHISVPTAPDWVRHT